MYIVENGTRFVLSESERWAIESDIKQLQANDKEIGTLYALCIQSLQSGSYEDKGVLFIETLFSPFVLPLQNKLKKKDIQF